MLSPGVRVGVGAVVRDSIVMFDSVIRSGAVVDRSILDKEVVVGQGAIVGDGPFPRPPEQAGAGPPEHRASRSSASGRSIPRGVRIGRNVRVAADIRSSDFVGRVIKSGESVEPRPTPKRRPSGRQARVVTGEATAAAAASPAPVAGSRRCGDR